MIQMYKIILTRRETGAKWTYHTRFDSYDEAFKMARWWDIFYRKAYIIKYNFRQEPYRVYAKDHALIWKASIRRV